MHFAVLIAQKSTSQVRSTIKTSSTQDRQQRETRGERREAALKFLCTAVLPLHIKNRKVAQLKAPVPLGLGIWARVLLWPAPSSETAEEARQGLRRSSDSHTGIELRAG